MSSEGTSSSGADKTTAAILAILLGWLGAHRFYVGHVKFGLVYLCFSWTGIPGLAGLIEGILMLTKEDEWFEQNYGAGSSDLGD